MDFLQFLDCLGPMSARTLWTESGPIRAVPEDPGDLSMSPEDPITYLANLVLGYRQWGPVQFLDAAAYLGMDLRLALRIAQASDNRGEPQLRAALLGVIFPGVRPDAQRCR